MGSKKNNEELQTTSNSTVFNRAARQRLKCPICPPRRGDNISRRKKRNSRRSWKKYRDTRWK